MQPIDWAQHQDLMKAELLGAKPALLFVVVRGRNAWNSTWVKHYTGPSALLGSLDAAKFHAESKRGPGNVFYISEVPGLALQTEAGPVALVEFHSDNCFGKWDLERAGHVLRVGTPMASVLSALGPNGPWRAPRPSKHSFISGRAAWRSIKVVPPRRPLKRWVSEGVGSKYALHWLQQTTNYSRQGVNRIIKAFQSINSEVDRIEAERRYWAAADLADEVRAQRRQERIDVSLAELEPVTLALLDLLERGQ